MSAAVEVEEEPWTGADLLAYRLRLDRGERVEECAECLERTQLDNAGLCVECREGEPRRVME